MKLGELTGQTLKWVQPHPFRLKYELHAGDMIVATLSYPRFSDTFAIASSDDGTWTFKGGELLHRNVTVRAIGAETDLAVFKGNTWGGGTMKLADGRKYGGVYTSRGTEYIFATAMGEVLVRYRNFRTLLRTSAETQIHPRAKDLAELSWFVMLGWHLALVTL